VNDQRPGRRLETDGKSRKKKCLAGSTPSPEFLSIFL